MALASPETTPALSQSLPNMLEGVLLTPPRKSKENKMSPLCTSNSSMFQGHPVLKGTIFKRSRLLLKQIWKKKWFVILSDGVLLQFASEDSWISGQRPKKVYTQLKDSSVVERPSLRSHAFAVVHKAETQDEDARHDIVFAANSEKEKQEWLEGLRMWCSGMEGAGSAHIEDFELLVMVGRGTFGHVIQVRHYKTGKIYAMKVLKKSEHTTEASKKNVAMERRVMECVRHPFIVRLVYAFQTRDKLFFVMDFVNGGDIYALLSTRQFFSEEMTRFYAGEALLALEYLHALGIAYRDLKPENLLIDPNGHIKLTDFGLAREWESTTGSTSLVGSPYYVAPEILFRRGHSHKVDWWSLGILIYEMLVGVPPYYSSNFNEAYKKIIENPQLEFPERVGEPARQLCRGLITANPSNRLGSADFESKPYWYIATSIREQSFFAGFDFDSCLRREMKVPYVPAVTGPEDVHLFELPRTSSPGDPTSSRLLLVEEACTPRHFEDFDFVSSSAGVLTPNFPSPRAVPPAGWDMDAPGGSLFPVPVLSSRRISQRMYARRESSDRQLEAHTSSAADHDRFPSPLTIATASSQIKRTPVSPHDQYTDSRQSSGSGWTPLTPGSIKSPNVTRHDSFVVSPKGGEQQPTDTSVGRPRGLVDDTFESADYAVDMSTPMGSRGQSSEDWLSESCESAVPLRVDERVDERDDGQADKVMPATVLLDEARWNYSRVAQGIIAAIVNHYQVQSIMNDQEDAPSERPRSMAQLHEAIMNMQVAVDQEMLRFGLLRRENRSRSEDAAHLPMISRSKDTSCETSRMQAI